MENKCIAITVKNKPCKGKPRKKTVFFCDSHNSYLYENQPDEVKKIWFETKLSKILDTHLCKYNKWILPCNNCDQSMCDTCKECKYCYGYVCPTEECSVCGDSSCKEWGCQYPNFCDEYDYCEICCDNRDSTKYNIETELHKFFKHDYGTQIYLCDSCYEIEDLKLKREIELRYNLCKKGLWLRSDSSLCRKYIENGNGCLEWIVDRMCQMKYLYEYTEYNSIRDKVFNDSLETSDSEDSEDVDFDYIRSRNLPKGAISKIAEEITMENTIFPKYWPWISNPAAMIIQKKVLEWIYKPYTRDGKLGPMVAKEIKKLGLNH